MCGIAGYARVQGQMDLMPAIEAMQHRGPDGYGIFENPQACVGLAHLRLSIIDLAETGAQPMQNSDTGLVLTYNGEIYNFPELRAELEQKGFTFRGTSDTEVLLTLLETEGLDALPRLNGMFAFAVHDRSTGDVTVVRDGCGIKPLYYATTREGVCFASELRGLRAMGVPMNDTPDPQVIARYMGYLWNPGTEIPSANIHTLAPGEAITLRAGKLIRRWEWFASPALSPQPLRRSEPDMLRETQDHLRQAVHRQLIADVPVGSFLSGGLDSSAIVAFAREVNPDIACFTIEAAGGPEAGTTDDLPYARAVADHLKVPLHVVRIDPANMSQDLEMMVSQLEEPLADPACLNVLYISQLARSQGIKVMLSGSGGDDLFTGYRRHRAVRIDEGLRYVPGAIRRALGRLEPHLNTARPFQRRLGKFLNGIGLDSHDRLINYFLWTRRTDILALLSADARAHLTDTSVTGPMVEHLSRMSQNASPIDQMLALEQRFFLAEHNLIYTDKMSMAASIEVRVPFLDHDLLRFATTLDHRVKQRGKEGKWVLKRAMEPFLPHDVIYRPKAGFGAPIRSWLDQDIRPLVLDVLSPESLRRRGIFDPAAVAQLMADNASGRKDASYTILSLLCIELWCRQFMDTAPAAA